jgi:hypothetical protein
MSIARPETLADWAAYVATLDGATLVSKARAANSIEFTTRLGEDGLSPDEVETVLVLFARQVARRGVHVGGDGLFDLRDLALRAPPIAIELPEQGAPIIEDLDGDED